MQYIYAFKQCKRANLYMGIEYIDDVFKPDLNAMEQPDPEKAAADHTVAIQLFKSYFQEQQLLADTTTDSEIKDIVLKAVEIYHKMCSKDKQVLGKELVKATEKIYESYLLSLLLLPALAKESEQRKKKSIDIGIRHETYEPAELNFANNQIIKALRSSEKLHALASEKKLNWSENRAEVRQWFRNLISKDNEFQNYQKLASTKFEDDKEIVKHIVNLLFEDQIVSEYLEEKDLNWTENKKIIKGMLKKSVKSVTEDHPEIIEISDLSNNWEEDKIFLEELYKITVDNDEEYETIIGSKIRNWTLDRLTMVDHTILKMAIAEMLNFSSIPVKVTINEYIDISKNYSTPKSKQFVNGLLDVIASDLQGQGKIQKSGRGLIDNQ